MLSDGGALGRPAEELGALWRACADLDSPSDIMNPASLEAAIVAAIFGITCSCCCAMSSKLEAQEVSRVSWSEQYRERTERFNEGWWMWIFFWRAVAEKGN
jgi:hypothetical protein